MSNMPQHVWTQEQVIQFWNYESRFPDRYFTRWAAPELIRHLRRHFSHTDEILDFGCGAGHLLQQLLERKYRVAGADSSPETLEKINRKFGNNAGFLGALSPDAFIKLDRKFDAVFVVEVVEHLYDEWLEQLLTTVRRLAKPGGRVMFTTPNDENLEDSSLVCPCCGGVFHRMQHVRAWSKDSLSAYLEERGLPVIDAFTADFDLSFEKQGKRLWVLNKKLKYWRKPKKKRPHLAVVCQVPQA
jgi:2-polyprenyl-3-methyl-5-hydroxy-6-metoxy-1,4-benzoquinol methylase